MLATWTIENFKSIYDRTTIDLFPLTIFAGPNSSGKSTILQSILLTTQTLQSSVQSRSVVLNGHIVRLGAFVDIASNTNEHRGINLGFTIRPSKEGSKLLSASQTLGLFPYYSHEIEALADIISCDFSFGCEGTDTEREAQQLQPKLLESKVKIDLKKDETSQDNEIHIIRTRGAIETKTKKLGLDASQLNQTDELSLNYDVLKPVGYKSRRRGYVLNGPSSGQPAGAAHAHFLPARLAVVYDITEENARAIIDVILNSREGVYIDEITRGLWDGLISPVIQTELLQHLHKCIEPLVTSTRRLMTERVTKHFELLRVNFSLDNYISLITNLPDDVRRLYASLLIERTQSLKDRLKAGKRADYKLAFVPLSAQTEYAVNYIRTYFSNQLKYLGPLRDEPKPVYPISGATDPRDVGFRGEHTAAVLDIHKTTTISYISTKDLSNFSSNPPVVQVSLITAVADWLDYLGVVTAIQTADKGKLGHELKVSTGQAESLHDLTHVGVGVSQVLPILVIALLAEPDSVLVFEQPELHLHPRVQTRLADFFVSMTLLRKQCLVETHSEYLINRLRYLSAISDGKKVSKDTIIYFVEKQDGHSHYRPIHINEHGVIGDWPKGFFDESEENAAALLKIAMQKRKRAKS